MYPNPKRAKKLYSEVVPKTVDDYLSLIEKYHNQSKSEQLLNPVWHVHNGKPPKEKIIMPFSMLLNLVGSSNADRKDILWKFINRFHENIIPEDYPILIPRIPFGLFFLILFFTISKPSLLNPRRLISA